MTNPTFKAAKILFQQPCFNEARILRETIIKSGQTFKAFSTQKLNYNEAKVVSLLGKVADEKQLKGRVSDKLTSNMLEAGKEFQEFRDNLSFAYFLNCYSNNLGYDYVVTPQLAPKLLLADGKHLPYQHFMPPNRCFFINIQSLGLVAEFDGKTPYTMEMRLFEDVLGLTAQYQPIAGEVFNWYKTDKVTGFPILLPQEDAIYDLIGFSCVLVDFLEPPFLNIQLPAGYKHEDVLILNGIYLRRGSSRYEIYPYFFTVDWIKRQSTFLGEDCDALIPTLKELKRFFTTDSNVNNFLIGLKATVNSILYLNTTTTNIEPTKVTGSEIKRATVKLPKKPPQYIDKPEYFVKSIGEEGVPESWGITQDTDTSRTDWIATDEEIDNLSSNTRTTRQMQSDYLEPHTRRAHLRGIWVTETHPRYQEAKMYEMKSRGNVVKMRGLIEIEVPNLEINKGKASKYEVKITRMK